MRTSLGNGNGNGNFYGWRIVGLGLGLGLGLGHRPESHARLDLRGRQLPPHPESHPIGPRPELDLARGLLSTTGMWLTFDRGTLLLEGAGPEALPEGVRDLLWDPRVGAWRAPAHRYLRVLEDLRAAGCQGSDRVGTRRVEGLLVRGDGLRPYQTDAIGAWEAAGRRGLVVLPTGSGKTHVAIGAMASAGVATLVLVPTCALLEQWVRRLAEHHPGPVGVVGDGQRVVRPLTVCTFASAQHRMDELGNRFGLVVADEAHHFGGGAYAEALEMCAAPARLGLTATPPERPEELARLDDVLGPIVYERRVSDFVGLHLAPFEHVVLRVELLPAERALYDAHHRPFAEAVRAFFRATPGRSWADLHRALGQSARGRAIVEGYHRAVHVVSGAAAKVAAAERLLRRHGADRALVFTADNRAAYGLSEALLLPAVTCDIPRAERDDILARFREGRVRGLVSARVLNEGIDVPEARVAIVLGGRMGRREHVQRVGRVLRPSAGKVATVYEIVAAGTFEERQRARRGEAL